MSAKRVQQFIAVTVLGVGSGSTLAHHSVAMFDRTKTVTVMGVVKEFQYTNPHSWLQVNVTDAQGNVVEWSFETEGPSTLQRAGIKVRSFMPGEKVTITASPMRDGRPAGSLRSVTKADGTVLNIRSPPQDPATNPTANIPAP